MKEYKPNRQIRYKNEQCNTFDRIGENGESIYKPKKAFDTDKEAIEAARVMNCKPTAIHKCVAYKCNTCGKWHVGRTQKVLTEKERQHYRTVGQPVTFKRHFDLSEVKIIIPSAEQELIIKRNLGLL